MNDLDFAGFGIENMPVDFQFLPCMMRFLLKCL